MKLPDKEQFNFKECEIANEKCWLIYPNKAGVDWTDDNLIFRSIIITQDTHEIVSMGFPKFFNMFECPLITPWDFNQPFKALKKIDGSLFIISKYKGELIHRTRGTVNAQTLPNGWEIDKILKVKYPLVFDNKYINEGYSLLMEWTTPNNIICIKESNEPVLTLIGAVKHTSFEFYMESQWKLDKIANELNVSRPKYYSYDSIQSCVDDVKLWEGTEGLVVYQENHRNFPIMRKTKSDWYLELHKMATGITTFEHVVDVFLSSPRFTEKEKFFEYVVNTLSWEVAIKCEEYIEKACELYNHLLARQKYIDDYMTSNGVYNYPTRREQAEEIFQFTRNSWERTIAFLLLDKRPLDDKLVKNIILHLYANES